LRWSRRKIQAKDLRVVSASLRDKQSLGAGNNQQEESSSDKLHGGEVGEGNIPFIQLDNERLRSTPCRARRSRVYPAMLPRGKSVFLFLFLLGGDVPWGRVSIRFA
jgi:hypothetical protein